MLNHQAAQLDAAFRALADPTRRAILDRLSRAPASVSDLAAPLPMSLPAVHQHLQVLAGSRLVMWEKRGRVRWCRLDAAGFRAVEDWVLARRVAWEQRLDALAAHLKNEEAKGRKGHGRAKRRP
ncbi:MAG TPA: metalloregulator ArsR/SmtB family transcription factor [Candidatus Binatia bacterium]|nr:metalloregulator ArsR/SmtB family transcription factor [Candidatus Binatia bacterium]